MFDFTSESEINRMVEIVEPVLDRLADKERTSETNMDGMFEACCGYYTGYDVLPSAVYKKTRELFLHALYKEIGLPMKGFKSSIVCEDGVLYSVMGERKWSLDDGFIDEMYDPSDFIPTGPFFWPDHYFLDGGYCDTDDLVDYLFSEEGLGYFSIENINKLDYDTFKKDFPIEYSDLKGMWLSQYSEEMTKALYNHLQYILEESCHEEVNLSHEISVNVAIVPFLNWWKKNYHQLDLRHNKIVNFAIRLIKGLKFTGPHSWVVQDCQCGYTENLFYNIQQLGNSYENEIFSVSLSLTATISMMLIDFVLAYLDIQYGFLPHDVRQMYRDKIKEAVVR